MKLNIKLQTKMILGFSFNFIIIIILFFIFMVFYIFNLIEDRILDNTQQMFIKQTQQVESYLKEVNQITKNFIVNKDIQDTLDRIDTTNSVIDGSARLIYNRKFDDIMNRMIPVTSMPLSHTYIYDRLSYYKYSYNSIGSNFELVKKDKQIMDRILDRQAVIVSNNRNNALSPYTTESSFSIIRPIYDINGKMYGYVEVQQDYKDLKNICNIGNLGKMFIADQYGKFLYPDHLISKGNADFIKSKNLIGYQGIIKSNTGTIFAYRKSDDLPFTFYMEISSQTVLAPLYLVKVITCLIIIIIALVALFMTYLTSRQLVNPIRKLKDDMMNIGLDSIDENMKKHIYHDEVEQLDIAFHDMLNRLKESMEREVASSQEEAKARFAALQAQIAPHFIHNVLYIISISAQENNPQGVVDMCKSLSNMLRYVVHSPFSQVTLEDEMNYTCDYLSLQAKNYEDSLIYHINIKEDVKKILLPRLVIQPFVENSIKHGFKNRIPSWIISIKAYIKDDVWTICIEDNGCGIKKETIDEINKKIGAENTDHLVNKTLTEGIGNMGISNTVMRLKLVYQEQLNFSIGTNENTGTIITITGPVITRTEQLIVK